MPTYIQHIQKYAVRIRVHIRVVDFVQRIYVDPGLLDKLGHMCVVARLDPRIQSPVLWVTPII